MIFALTVQIDATWPAVVVAALGLVRYYIPERRRGRRPLRLAIARSGRKPS